MAIINVQSLAFTRYANIFKRKSEPHFKKPVAIVTYVDIPFDEEDGNVTGDKAKLTEAQKAKAAKFDGQCVQSFIAPRWTLEYCLSQYFLVFVMSALASPALGWWLQKLAGGGARFTLDVFVKAESVFIVAIVVAAVLSLFMKETGPAVRPTH